LLAAALFFGAASVPGLRLTKPLKLGHSGLTKNDENSHVKNAGITNNKRKVPSLKLLLKRRGTCRMYLILPVPVVLRLMALILQLSEIMDQYVNIEFIQVRIKASEVESNTTYNPKTRFAIYRTSNQCSSIA
jgi:hypothetical protein